MYKLKTRYDSIESEEEKLSFKRQLETIYRKDYLLKHWESDKDDDISNLIVNHVLAGQYDLIRQSLNELRVKLGDEWMYSQGYLMTEEKYKYKILFFIFVLIGLFAFKFF